MRLILTFTVLCVWCFASEEKFCDVLAKEETNYAFYYPLVMESKKPAKVCLKINENLLPGKIKISFENQTFRETQHHVIDTGFPCWDIIAPEFSKGRYTTHKIKVEIETKEKNIKFMGEEDVQLIGTIKSVFIETDRKVYKNGDTVKIRLVALGFDLKPLKDYKIPFLQIRSPSYTIIKKWENISTDLGLAQIEFQLAPDTVEGIWYINSDGISTNFEVKKYVLPRFEVSIEGPKEIYEGEASVSFSVCGKYSYGWSVKGTASIVLQVISWVNNRTQSRVKELNGGCAKFEFFGEELFIQNHEIRFLDITGTITEAGTDQAESNKKVVHVNAKQHFYYWDMNYGHIKPELPHKAKLIFHDEQILVNVSRIPICYRIAMEEDIVCSNFTLDSNNSIEVTVPPLKNVTALKKIQIEAKLDNPSTKNPILYLTVWYSDSKNAIKILKTKSNSEECGSTLSFNILYNSGRFKKDENIEFKYILSSRNEILSSGSVLDKPKQQNLNLDKYPNVIGKAEYKINDNPVDMFELEIELDSKVYTNSKLLVYYDYNKEVVSDYTHISVTKCAPNKVKAKWADSTLYPGEIGQLNIETDSNSLCSVSSIDKATTFLGLSERITVDSILNSLHEVNYHDNNRLNCIKAENMTNFIRSSLRDSSDSFKELSIGIISNMKFISKPCDGGAFAYGGYGGYDFRGSAVRSFFPETWLWDLVPVGESGEITIERKLPDSITDWIGNVICISPNKGFGLSDTIEMKGFKPFFLDILLPYSIKRNKEILHLPIPIFNYLNHSLPIRVSLKISDDIVLVDSSENKSFSMCLGAEDSYTHKYRIKSTKMGYANITVSANVDPSYAENCASESVIRRRDVVRKSLLVEPEGYPSTLLMSALLTANDSAGSDIIDWQINLPENAILDTVDGKVLMNSDMLGPMFQNLENILVIPTGCGEQTMATLSPNLYVLKYLEARNALTEDTKKRILKNLEIGYQRMLNYVHDDGSFSAFGKSDQGGSMFLTAFVIRTFKQMKKYIFIDDDVINKAVKWIINHQLENGCFNPVHHVFHDMGQASSKNQTTALTSYVMISVLETNINIEEDVIFSARDCILTDNTMDKYTMAISSYALGLMNIIKDVQKRLDKLIELADKVNGLTWWTQSKKSLSANVEVSSYVLLTLLRQDATENMETASSIVKWLQSEMNPRGGFYTTQDTVIGLDAISLYAMHVNKKDPNINILTATNNKSEEFKITKRDSKETKVIKLDSYPNKVRAKISGTGYVTIQAAVNYYLNKPLVTDVFKLDITLKPFHQKLKCSVIKIKPCVSYTSPGMINMAIVEVTLLSGYVADENSLNELISSSSTGVKKFEQIRNQVVFYLTQLDSNEVCLPFQIEENLVIEDVANSTVKLYDYYKPEMSVSKSFTLGNCS